MLSKIFSKNFVFPLGNRIEEDYLVGIKNIFHDLENFARK